MMKRKFPVLKAIVGLVVGAIVGGIVGGFLGFYSAIALGLFSQWTHPNDPSAGSVAIVVVATLPGGVLYGLAIGGVLGYRWMTKNSPQTLASDPVLEQNSP